MLSGVMPPTGSRQRAGWQYCEPRLDHRRAHLLGREQLQHIGAFGQCGERFGGRGHPRRQVQAYGFRGAQDLGIAVGHNDHLAASGFDLLDLLRRQHRAGTDQAIGGQAVAQGADAGVRVRRSSAGLRSHRKPASYSTWPTAWASSGRRPRRIAIKPFCASACLSMSGLRCRLSEPGGHCQLPQAALGRFLRQADAGRNRRGRGRVGSARTAGRRLPG